MPQYPRTPDPLQRIAALEDRLARLERASRVTDEVPFYPATFDTMLFTDATDWAAMWETTITPRGASLVMQLITIGDQVSGTNTGGEWRVQLNGVTTVASGLIAATFTYDRPSVTIDLAPYRGQSSLTIGIHGRRTSGATTGGRFGFGGSVGVSPLYARLL